MVSRFLGCTTFFLLDRLLWWRDFSDERVFSECLDFSDDPMRSASLLERWLLCLWRSSVPLLEDWCLLEGLGSFSRGNSVFAFPATSSYEGGGKSGLVGRDCGSSRVPPRDMRGGGGVERGDNASANGLFEIFGGCVIFELLTGDILSERFLSRFRTGDILSDGFLIGGDPCLWIEVSECLSTT